MGFVRFFVRFLDILEDVLVICPSVDEHFSEVSRDFTGNTKDICGVDLTSRPLGIQASASH